MSVKVENVEQAKAFLERQKQKATTGKVPAFEKCIELLDEHVPSEELQYFRTSVSRGKSKGNYYPRISFQNKVLSQIGFDYKTPLKVRVDLENKQLALYKE